MAQPASPASFLTGSPGIFARSPWHCRNQLYFRGARGISVTLVFGSSGSPSSSTYLSGSTCLKAKACLLLPALNSLRTSSDRGGLLHFRAMFALSGGSLRSSLRNPPPFQCQRHSAVTVARLGRSDGFVSAVYLVEVLARMSLPQSNSTSSLVTMRGSKRLHG